MKVLHFSALDGRTGAGVAAARIHQGLRARGVESRFCVVYPSAGLEASFIPRSSLSHRLVRAASQRINDFALRRDAAGYDYVLSTGLIGFDMGKIIAAERPDVVHLHWIGGNAFKLESLKGVKIPVVWRLSDMWPFCGLQHLEPDPEKYAAPVGEAQGASRLSEHVRRIKQATYRTVRSLNLVAPSRWIAAETQRSALLGDRPIEVIATSCDTELFRPMDRPACRAVLGLPLEDDIVLVGATSMGTRWKGLDLFLDAARQIGLGQVEGARPIHIVTFGKDTLEAASLEGLVKITHLGTINDRRLMAIAYGAADVFVAPSRMENLANTVLESLACGTPVVAFDIGGMPDMIDHKVNGYLAQPFDSRQMAEGMCWLLGRPDRRDARIAARKTVEAGFSLNHEIDGYIGLYGRLLADDQAHH